MSRAASFATFLSIVLSVLGAAHYYVWARLVRDVALAPGLQIALTALVVALFVSLPVTLWAGRSWSRDRARPFLLVGYGWMGVLLLLLALLGLADGLRALLALTGAQSGVAELVWSRGAALAVIAVVSGLGALAVRSGLGQVAIRTVPVELERLPRELDGFVIAQLSDVHVGPTIGREFVERIVQRTNELEPDAIVITGDLVDGSVHALRDAVAPLAGLRARHGVFFVTGNHEYYSGASAWCQELARLGIRVLRNERVRIGSAGASFDLAGVDDYSARGFGRGHGADLARALEGRDASRELVLLAHQPRAIFEAERVGVGLQLSGHTHGGQLWPWNYLVRLQQPTVSGLSRFGSAQLYTSNGTGYWGPPMRLGAPAEITRVVLRSKEPASSVARAA